MCRDDQRVPLVQPRHGPHTPNANPSHNYKYYVHSNFIETKKLARMILHVEMAVNQSVYLPHVIFRYPATTGQAKHGDYP